MTDEQRTDSFGCYGSPWAVTPNLDRLANEGNRFSNAVTPAPVCAPARASMLTGEYPCRNGVWYNQGELVDSRYLTEKFRDAGYATASFGKQHYDGLNRAFETEYNLTYSSEVSAFAYRDVYDQADFDVVHYPPEPYPWIFGGRFPAESQATAEAISIKRATEWLSQRSSQTPFFLRISFNGPHTPVVPPEPFDRCIDAESIVYPPEVESRPENLPEWLGTSLMAMSDSSRLTREQIVAMRRYYYGQVSYLDQLFGELTRWMDGRGLLDNTILAFVSDHGTHLGDYGLVQNQTFFEPVVTVPMMIWCPSLIAEKSVIKTPVEVRSLLPTLLELAGLEISEDFSGISLAECLTQAAEPDSRPVFSEFTLGSFGFRHTDRLVLVRDGFWKLSLCLDVQGGDGALYNLENDPLELDNLFDRSEFSKTQSRLTSLILEHVESSKPPLPAAITS